MRRVIEQALLAKGFRFARDENDFDSFLLELVKKPKKEKEKIFEDYNAALFFCMGKGIKKPRIIPIQANT
jgi:hypothetical protein